MINIKVYYTEKKLTLDFNFKANIKTCELWKSINEKFHLADDEPYRLYIKDGEY